MTVFSAGDITHLAGLSGLSLEHSEVESLQADLQKIIAFVDKIDSLVVEGVEPTYQISDTANISRDDQVVDSQVSSDELLALGKEVQDHQMKVPQVL